MHQRKRPEDRIGHPHGASVDEGPVTRGRSRRHEITVLPEASERWLPQSRSWFNSLKLSGQTEFWEASDWATAVCAAEVYDRFVRTRNASLLAQFTRLSERLGVTAIDRKRARVELETPDADEQAADASILRWHARLGIRPLPDPESPA
jgi:hypothetical protein